MNDQGKEVLDCLMKVRRMHVYVYDVVKRAEEAVKSKPMDQGDRVDLIHLLRRVRDLCDDLRKEAAAAEQMAVNVTCAVWSKESESSDAPRSIRGEIVLGTPNVKMSPKLPSATKQPEEFAQLMGHFGLSADSPAVKLGAIRPHWPGMLEYVSMLLEEGKNPPPGIDPSDLEPHFTMTVRIRTTAEDMAASCGVDNRLRKEAP